MDERIALLHSTMYNELQHAIDSQADSLSMTAQAFAADPYLHSALGERNTARLMADWSPVYKAMHREYGITHFSFFDDKRVCLARMHAPERSGETVSRNTVLKAEQTGKVVAGMELAGSGALTMRVVQPVFRNNVLLGYIEFGKDIENILANLYPRFGSHVTVAVYKKLLNREEWETTMLLSGNKANWDQMDDNVVTYTSHSYIHDNANFNCCGSELWHPAKPITNILRRKRLRISTPALHDISGQKDICL